jgi:hypothetical protein
MTRWHRSFPFTILGLLTIVMFLVGEWLNSANVEGTAVDIYYSLLRLLIIPLWVMRYFVVVIGQVLFDAGERFPAWFNIITMPIHLVPYFVMDLLFRAFWWPARGNAKVVAR